MKPTEEQQVIVEQAVAGNNIAIQAIAGADKSSTLKLIAEEVVKTCTLLRRLIWNLK